MGTTTPIGADLIQSGSGVFGYNFPPNGLAATDGNDAMIPPSAALGNESKLPVKTTVPSIPEAQMASAYRIGRYTPAERRLRLERYREKRATRNYNRRVKYDCRKVIADKRRRVQGRFVKREEELALVARQDETAIDDDVEDSFTPQDPLDEGIEDEAKAHSQQPDSSISDSSAR